MVSELRLNDVVTVFLVHDVLAVIIYHILFTGFFHDYLRLSYLLYYTVTLYSVTRGREIKFSDAELINCLIIVFTNC